MLVLTVAAGNTGWHYMIMRHARYAPHLSNYSGAAGGRTFRSAAGFHTSEGHNTWCANRPRSTLLIPVGDIAQHMIAALSFLVQNGYVRYDDVNGEQVAGLERFSHLTNLEEPLPLTFMETYALTACTTELSTCCYAGV